MSTARLPKMLRPLFWDYNFDTLTWEEDRELIISRVLISGSWDAVTWLRSRAGDQYLREWIERLQGKGLSPLQLRFWELIWAYITNKSIPGFHQIGERSGKSELIDEIPSKGCWRCSKNSALETWTSHDTAAVLPGGRNCPGYLLGHRHSVDLDWFTGEQIKDPLLLAQEIRDGCIPLRRPPSRGVRFTEQCPEYVLVCSNIDIPY